VSHRETSIRSLLIIGLSAACAYAQNYTPLTSSERWHLYARETVLSPGLYFASLGSALGSQLDNKPPEWRQGVAGYGRRATSQLGLLAIDETLHEAGSAALGYDPRYLRCDCHGFWKRSGHAIAWTLLTKNAAGETRLDIPRIAGSYGSGMISTLWKPARLHPLTDGVRDGHQQLGFDFGIDLVKEFAPELKRVFSRSKPTPAGDAKPIVVP